MLRTGPSDFVLFSSYTGCWRKISRNVKKRKLTYKKAEFRKIRYLLNIFFNPCRSTFHRLWHYFISDETCGPSNLDETCTNRWIMKTLQSTINLALGRTWTLDIMTSAARNNVLRLLHTQIKILSNNNLVPNHMRELVHINKTHPYIIK